MDELKVIGENKAEFKVAFDKTTNVGVVDGQDFSWDVAQINKSTYHVIKDNKSYNIEVLKFKPDTKEVFLKVNGNKYKYQIKDKFDELLKSLGMDNLATTKVSDLKAPMPGLVLEVDVEVGQSVAKGDTLLILEAMKMENVIKSPTDGVIKSIVAKKGEAVEKNQVLLNFE
jgi:biotin carboxyl carrier protein